MRKKTDFIVVHCSATKPSIPAGVKEIDRWHKARGWAGIGYAWVVRRDGTVEKGRDENAVGAHVEGHNHNTVGVCWEGGLDEKTLAPVDNRTAAQKRALRLVLKGLRSRFPRARIQGHRDFPGVKKACPCFDAKLEYTDLQPTEP